MSRAFDTEGNDSLGDFNDTVRARNLTMTDRLLIKHVGLSVVSFFAIIGNALLIFTIVRNRHLRTTTNVFIVSLATADLVFGFPIVPIHIVAESAEGPMFGLSLTSVCLVSMSLTSFQIATSVLSLFAITVERYLCILHPLKHRKWARPHSVAAIIGALWSYGLLIGAIPMMGWNAFQHYVPWESGGNSGGIPVPRCHFVIANTGQYIGFLFFVVLFPVYSAMPYLYWHMFWAVRQFISRRLSRNTHHVVTSTDVIAQQIGRREQSVRRRTNRRSLRLLVVLTIYSVFSWTPELIWYMAATRGFTLTHMNPERFQNIPISMLYYQIASNFGFASSALNPYIYGLGNVRIRRAVLNMFRSCGCRKVNCTCRNTDHLELYSASCHLANGVHIARASSIRSRSRNVLDRLN